MSRRLFPLLLLAIIVSGLFLRLIDVGAHGLWIDEAFSLWLAERPLADLLHWVTRVDHHPPLYYVLLRGWLALFGPAEVSARGLSVLFGAMTIPVAYALGRRLVSRQAGLISALLLALSPLHVRLSQEARMYAFLTLVVALALWAFIRLYDAWTDAVSQPGSPSRGEDRSAAVSGRDAASSLCWIAYVVFTAAMLWTHNTAFFFPVALNLLVLGRVFIRSTSLPIDLTGFRRLSVVGTIRGSGAFAGRAGASETCQVSEAPRIDPRAQGNRPTGNGTPRSDRGKVRTTDTWLGKWLLAQVAVFLLWMPWLPALVSQAADVYRRFWLPRPTAATVASVVGALLFEAPPWPLPLTALVTALLAVLAVRGLVTLRRQSRYAPVLAAVFLLPLAGQWVVSFWRPILYVRTLSWLSVPLHLLVAVGVVELGTALSRRLSRRAVLVALTALVLVNGAVLAHDHAAPEKEAWDDAAALVAERVQPDDLLLFSGSWGQIPFDYYLGRLYNPQLRPPVARRGLPVDLFNRGVLEPEMTEDDLPRLRALTSGRERVWLIYSHEWYTDPKGLIPRALAATMTLDQEWAFPGLQVRLYVAD